MNEERLVSNEGTYEESRQEVFLRPEDFTEYIGQKKVVQNMFIE